MDAYIMEKTIETANNKIKPFITNNLTEIKITNDNNIKLILYNIKYRPHWLGRLDAGGYNKHSIFEIITIDSHWFEFLKEYVKQKEIAEFTYQNRYVLIFLLFGKIHKDLGFYILQLIKNNVTINTEIKIQKIKDIQIKYYYEDQDSDKMKLTDELFQVCFHRLFHV